MKLVDSLVPPIAATLRARLLAAHRLDLARDGRPAAMSRSFTVDAVASIHRGKKGGGHAPGL